MTFDVTIRGIADVNRILKEIAPNEAKNLMRATVQAIAVDVAKAAKDRTPDDTGLLDKSIKAKRERGTRTTIASSVRVAGAAFYWRFLEYGQGPDNVEHAMFLQTLQALRPEIDRKYLEIFTAKLIARLARKRRASGG